MSLPLSEKQRAVLDLLAERGPTGIGDIGTAVGCGKGMGGLLQSLLQRGVVRCNRDDRKARSNRLTYSLSAAGEQLLKELAR